MRVPSLVAPRTGTRLGDVLGHERRDGWDIDDVMNMLGVLNDATTAAGAAAPERGVDGSIHMIGLSFVGGLMALRPTGRLVLILRLSVATTEWGGLSLAFSLFVTKLTLKLRDPLAQLFIFSPKYLVLLSK